jgi:hypothetical protein
LRWPAGQLFSSLPCSVRFLYPSPYGGGAGYHPSWVRQVCPARPQAAHVGLTGPVFGLAGVTLPYSAPKTAHGATQSRFPFLLQKRVYPSPYGGGAAFHLSWVRRVYSARPQAAHVGPTGPVFGLAGVVSLLGFQNRTQGHTEPSLISPFFPNALWVWQSYQIPLQLVFHCFLDGPDRVTQIPVPHQACLGFYFCRLCVNQSLLFQLPYVFCNRVSAHACVLANPPDTGPALMRFPVLAENQVGVDRQLAGA